MSVGALFFGDVTLDRTLVVDHVPAPDEKVHVERAFDSAGGVVCNAAVACALAGVPATFVCSVGDDPTAAQVLALLEERGVSVAADAVAGATSRVTIILESHGEKRLLLDPGASFYPSVETAEALDLEGMRWVHTAVYGDAAVPLVRRCRQAGIPWSLDLEPATFAAGIDPCLPLIDGAELVLCNDKAAAMLGGDAAERLLAWGARGVVRTMGSGGARYRADGVDVHARVAAAVDVLDTTGAGDCLAGWMIAGALQGVDIGERLRLAVSAAAFACTAYGAQSSYPARADVLSARTTNHRFERGHGAADVAPVPRPGAVR